MNHTDHVNLLRPADLETGGVWADMGAGSGAFTLALRELIGPQATIYAVDKDRAALEELQRAYARRFQENGRLEILQGDFTTDVPVSQLDGILMANSLHFHRAKGYILGVMRALLKPAGMLLLVEYNVDKGNPWVPFPISFPTFKDLAIEVGFSEPKLVATHPSSFLREIYSAVARAV